MIAKNSKCMQNMSEICRKLHVYLDTIKELQPLCEWNILVVRRNVSSLMLNE